MAMEVKQTKDQRIYSRNIYLTLSNIKHTLTRTQMKYIINCLMHYGLLFLKT